VEAQTAPTLEPGGNLVSNAVKLLYFTAQPDPSETIKQRDTTIRARYAAGVSQAELARQFGISYQRVHQIIHGENR